MSLKKIKNIIQWSLSQVWDLEHIQNVIYNEATGAQKNIDIEPVVKEAYTANTQVAFGSLIKVAAGTTSYNVACVGKAHSSSASYRRGNLVVQAGRVYIASVDHDPKTFDAEDWVNVAPASITGIPVSGGAVVCTGKYHNSINVDGFLIDDESTFSKAE
jgi:predicted transposase YbfD/YdcC